MKILSRLVVVFFMSFYSSFSAEILDLAKTVTQPSEKELTLSQEEAKIVIKSLEDPKARALLITQLKALGKIHQDAPESATEKIQGVVKSTGRFLEEITAFPLKALPRLRSLYTEYTQAFMKTWNSGDQSVLFSLALNLLFMGGWFLLAPIQRMIHKSSPGETNSWKETIFMGFVTVFSFVAIIIGFTLIQTLIGYLGFKPLYSHGDLSFYLLVWQTVYIIFFLTLNLKKDTSIGKLLSLSWYAFGFFSFYLFSIYIGLNPKTLHAVETVLKTAMLFVFLRSLMKVFNTASPVLEKLGSYRYILFGCFWVSMAHVVTYLSSPLSDSLELSLRLLTLYGFWHGFIFLAQTSDADGLELEDKYLNKIPFYKNIKHKRFEILTFLLSSVCLVLSFPTFEKLVDFWTHPQLTKWLTVTIIISIMYGISSTLTDFIKEKIDKDQEDDRTKAVMASLWPVFKNFIKGVVFFIGLLLCLAVLDYPIMPLLVSLSFAGLALGFGAQNAIKDLLGGIFILLEKNLAVGDYVDLGGFCGKVEKITLRSVYLRLGTGALQTLPFSEIKSIINKSREINYCCVEAYVGYGSNLAKVQDLMRETFMEMKNDPLYQERIIDDFSFYGLDKQKDFGLSLTGRFQSLNDPVQELTKVYMLKLHQKLFEHDLFPRQNVHSA